MPWRVAPKLAPLAYGIALAVTTLNNGLPLEHATLFIWLVLGCAAFSVRAWRSWGRLVLEWLPLVSLVVLYDYLRGAVGVPDTQAHIATQVGFDRWVGGGHVPTVWLQHHLYDPGVVHWYDVAIWCTYLSHFFAIWVVAAVLWKVAHDRYLPYVALVVTLTLITFLTYWLYPAQPPWMAADHGAIGSVEKVVPNVWDHLGVPVASSLFETGDGLVNLVAAMPSLHAAYPMMLLLFFWNKGWGVRAGLGLYTLAMGFALVYGGEHFVLDIVVGWAYAVVSYALVRAGAALLARRHADRAVQADRLPVQHGVGDDLLGQQGVLGRAS